MKGPEGESIAAKLARLTDPIPTSAGCLLWTAYLDRHGYGQLRDRGRTLYAHRAAWELANGPIPNGLVIDHLCRVPACVNVEHLRVVTRAFNVMIGESLPARNARKERCLRGHNDWYHQPDGYRKCNQCRRERVREQRRGLTLVE